MIVSASRTFGEVFLSGYWNKPIENIMPQLEKFLNIIAYSLSKMNDGEFVSKVQSVQLH